MNYFCSRLPHLSPPVTKDINGLYLPDQCIHKIIYLYNLLLIKLKTLSCATLAKFYSKFYSKFSLYIFSELLSILVNLFLRENVCIAT